MINFLFIIFGLSSAISFGTGDFTGGYISKKSNVFLVLLYSQIAGLIFLFISIFFLGEILITNSILFGFASGIFGAIGLLAFYRGLSMGNMGIVAPITSVITPIIPFLYSFFQLNYSINQIFGIIIALTAIWLVSKTKLEKEISLNSVLLAIIAGICFGSFLLLIDLASTQESYLYPIVFARISSLFLITGLIYYNKLFEIPQMNRLGMMALIGILDTAGNVFFILSSKAGRVDFASIILSLGPVITVLLAWKLLNEKLSKLQIFGIILSLIAIYLLSI